jgi:chromosome segregation ATPase
MQPALRTESKDPEANLLTNSKQREKNGELADEAVELRPPHTPEETARRLPDEPAMVGKVLSNLLQVKQHAAQNFRVAAGLPLARPISGEPVSSSRVAAPSEEDLFYLLMHRQRQRKDVESRLSARLKHLETVNTRLSQQNQNYQRQLRASCISRDRSATEAHSQKEALENFKTRFQKLKAFVNGLGHDYSALRQQADQIKISQQTLLNEKEDIRHDVKSCRTASTASEQSVNSIASGFTTLRQSIAASEQSLAEARKALEAENSLLLKEQYKNKRLETYLVQVASTQNRYSAAIQNEQKAVLNQLKDISTKVSAVEKATVAELQPLVLSSLDECVRMLTRIHDAERVEPADMAKFTDKVNVLSERLVLSPGFSLIPINSFFSYSFSSYRKTLDEGFQAAAEAQANSASQVVAQINVIHETLHATAIQEEQLAGLREDKIRLGEQLKSSENVMREIREGRTSADARESHLRATTDSLLDQLKTLRNQAIHAQKPSPPLDERDMIGTWQLKYTNISLALAKSEERLSAREDDIRQVEENVRTLTVKLDAAQAEQNAAVQTLKEANERAYAQASEIGELQQKVSAFRMDHLGPTS